MFWLRNKKNNFHLFLSGVIRDRHNRSMYRRDTYLDLVIYFFIFVQNKVCYFLGIILFTHVISSHILILKAEIYKQSENEYEIVVPTFGAAYAASNNGTTILY